MTKKTADADPIFEQGEAARTADLGRDACPYGEGDNRDAWLKGYGPDADPADEPAPE
jgi:ribosome modulation factor